MGSSVGVCSKKQRGNALKKRPAGRRPAGLSLSKNWRFSDNLCLVYAKHGREKVPVRKLFLSESAKAEVHALSFCAFAEQMPLDARCRAYCSSLVKRFSD
jgi:hypothetical protein